MHWTNRKEKKTERIKVFKKEEANSNSAKP